MCSLVRVKLQALADSPRAMSMSEGPCVSGGAKLETVITDTELSISKDLNLFHFKCSTFEVDQLLSSCITDITAKVLVLL